ncbi:hypothetical protein JCM11251_000262 [Rhodosporidiobolus azoricus]
MGHFDRFERHVKRQTTLVVSGTPYYLDDPAASAAAATSRANAPPVTTSAAPRTTVARLTTTTTTATPARTTTTPAAATTTTTTSQSARPDWRTRSKGTDSTSVAATSSNARNIASSSSSSTHASSASGAAASGSSGSSSGGGTSGGAIAGAVIAVIAVLAIAAGGYFYWRKKKAARAASGFAATGGNGGNGGYGAGAVAGGYDKRHETGDSELFANSSASPNGSWSGEEKFGAAAAGGALAGAGAYGAMHHGQQQARDNDPWVVQQQQNNLRAVSPSQVQSQPHQSWAAPSFASSTPSQQQYPSANVPGSTVNLLGGGNPLAAPVPMQNQHNGLTSSPFSDAHHSSIEQRELQQELDNRRASMMNATAAATSAAAAAADGAAAESSPFGESEGQGEIRIVKGTFDPSLEDELVLYPGDRVQVLMKYDDGWALGLNLNSGNPPAKGVFPFDCLGDLAPAPTATEIRSPGAPRALSPALGSGLPPALQPASPDMQQHLQQQQQQRRQSMGSALAAQASAPSPVNPANIPLPPPTPTPTTSQSGHGGAGVLASIDKDGVAVTTSRGPSPINTSVPPQLAPLTLGGGSDSPLAASFAPLSSSAPAVSPTHEIGASQALALAPVKQTKRHSSLIASRDADLFVALGEVLGDAEKEKEAKEAQAKQESA